LPEPTPTDETLELAERITRLGLVPSWLVINQVRNSGLSAADRSSLAHSRPSTGTSPAARAVDRAIAAAKADESGVECLARLARELPIPQTRLPRLLDVATSRDLEPLVEALAVEGGAG
jgi:hypothetical protein